MVRFRIGVGLLLALLVLSLLQAYGLKYTPSSEGSIILCFESVFGVLASVIFYHEQVTFKIFAGFALIFIAVIVVNVRRK